MINFEDLVHRTNKALLLQADINTILNSGDEYVTFHINVANSGHSVSFTTHTDDVPLDHQEWNGYDFYMPIWEFEEKLERVGVIMEIGGAYKFFWEVE